MRAGALRHLVTVEAPVEATDAEWGAATSWTAAPQPVHAEVRPVAGNEKLRAQAVSGEVNYIVRTRFTDTITPRHRLRWRDLILEIKAVIDVDARGRELEIHCTSHEDAQT